MGRPVALSYGTAKSALNAITAHCAGELGEHGFAVSAVSTGHLATDLTRGNAPLTAGQGAATTIALAVATSTDANARFLDEGGEPVPW
ncbi:MAG TPA: hypothetical protein VMF65_18465 [Acidimicrobiales bacterium]|nr:hypothetical protein [Acidimicrobiales bacterium]